MPQGFDYKSGKMMGRTPKPSLGSRSGKDVVKDLRAQIKLGKK